MLCPKCGTEYESGVCPKGCLPPELMETPKKKRKNTWLVWLCLVFVGFVLGFTVGAYNIDNRQPYEGDSSTEIAYKYSCQVISPETLAEKADQYIGNAYTFSGKVLQVMTPKDAWNDTVGLRILVSEGDAEGVIYATVEVPADGTTFKKGDSLSLWGTCKGLYTYQPDTGKAETLPKIDIVYYKLKK